AGSRQRDAILAPGGKYSPQPKLTGPIQQWASAFGYGVEPVQTEMRRRGQEAVRRRTDSSLVDQPLTPDAIRESEEAADLFREAAANALQRLEEVRKQRRTTDQE